MSLYTEIVNETCLKALRMKIGLPVLQNQQLPW